MRTVKTALIVGLCAASSPLWAEGLPSPLTDDSYRPVNLAEAQLGQLLFYDPLLSGNTNISCATCHHTSLGTADGMSLSLGEGGIGLGPDRVVDPANVPEDRIPRNAPALFNLGAHEFTVLFHDGRIEVDPSMPGGFRTPLDADMATGFASLLAAQTMFPVLSRDEMAGNHRENPIGKAVRQGLIAGEGGAWDQIARRVAAIPAYADQFTAVYPHITNPDQITFADVSNAIAAFMEHEWRSDTAPFDSVLRGEATLAGDAAAGMDLFYGDAGCADCHSGPFLTDHGFHAMAAPQIGPGKAASFEADFRDEGRYRVTGDPADKYAFRTPSLRNVALTGPYGHAGAHADLAGFIAAHADPVAGLASYDRGQAILAAYETEDFAILDDPTEREAIAAAVTVTPVSLTQADIAQLVAFLDSLTDPVSVTGRLGVPDAVPSGLPFERGE